MWPSLAESGRSWVRDGIEPSLTISWGGPRPSLGGYVTGMGSADGATAPPEGTNVGYPRAHSHRRSRGDAICKRSGYICGLDIFAVLLRLR